MAANSPSLYIALYTDADVYGELASQLRAREFDAISTMEAGNTELSDPAQLEYAVSQKRAIVTFNIQDFEPLHREYLRDEKSHYGIIVCNQIELGELLRRLLKLLNQIDADQMKNTYHHLGEFK